MDRVEEVRNFLTGLGLRIDSEGRVNDAGHQIRCRKGSLKGPVVNLWDNGNVNVQGEVNVPGKTRASLTEEIKAISFSEGPATPPPSRDVFVVYGHDRIAREQLENILRRWELNPILLDKLPSSGQTIIEKLVHYQGIVTFAVVLLTPDDVGYAKNQSADAQPRARQNVVLELGMLLSQLGRARVAILYRGPMERPSDIDGLMYSAFATHVDEARDSLYRELMAAGIPIDPLKF